MSDPKPSNFDGDRFANKAEGFHAPAQLPGDAESAHRWQETNKRWWEATPMRYDWREPIAFEEGTKEYFAEVDRRFLDAVRHYLPWKHHPFEQFIPYGALGAMDVLEIGVGQGTHAQLIAPNSKSFTGIDLTEKASSATRRRLQVMGTPGRVLQMDAERMDFPDASFDFIWSWGVIHHSSNTRRVLGEMARVLRPGGSAAVMVYYRSPLQYYLFNGLGRGLLKREFWSVGDIHKINQAATDGALARFFSTGEFRALVDGLFRVDYIEITGQKHDAVPLPHGRVKSAILDALPDPLSRFATDRLRMGTFLVAGLTRP